MRGRAATSADPSRPGSGAFWLDAFRVESLIAVGGMGQVWRATAGATPVAIKVMAADAAREPKYVAGFRREVRAVAQLSHPHIVTVLDHGLVSTDAQRASGDALVAGSPYLVMELAQSTLHHELVPPKWSETRAVLLSLLGALAHAHAHDILHRDIKPANALIFAGRGPVGGRLKLTDFGLAFLRGERDDAIGAGTPKYMAPEQFTGAGRELGSWTDLYAVGCIAYKLVSGRAPFDGPSDTALELAHREIEPPELEPFFSLPVGARAWIARLLAKDHRQRFRRAADAAYALEQLGDPPRASSPMLPVFDDPTAPTRSRAVPGPTDASRTVVTPPSRTVLHDGVELGPVTWVSAEELAALPSPDAPPMPADWRDREVEASVPQATVGLFGMRPLPLVGRETERDALWEALRVVHEQRHARVVVLRGAAGFGKSRLAEWLRRRSHELGVARTLVAEHAPMPSNAHGLGGMLATYLRCVGLPREDVLARVRRLRARDPTTRAITEDVDTQLLVELMSPASRPSLGSARFATPRQRYALIRRFLAGIGLDRPAVVHLDDVQWGADSLAFVQHVLEADAEELVPALFVLTVQDEALAERPVEAHLLGRLFAEPGRVQWLPIGPLSDADNAALVQHLVPLDAQLARSVCARTAGNPLFAVQLVRDWIQRDVLEPADAGLVLRNTVGGLPNDVHAVWSQRIARVLLGQPTSSRVALELAAMAGRTVDPLEWRAVCGAAGVEHDPALLEDLLDAALVRTESPLVSGRSAEVRWSFVHPMLRESLERSAAEKGRAPELHRAWASVLSVRFAAGFVDVAERLAMHLLGAGGPEMIEAAGPLAVAAEEHLARSELDRAEQLLDAQERVLVARAAGEEDPQRIAGLCARAELAFRRGLLPVATADAERVAALALKLGLERPRASALCITGYGATVAGRPSDARTQFGEAHRIFDALADDLGAARALRGLAVVDRFEGAHARARAIFAESLELSERQGDLTGMASSLTGMAFCDRTPERPFDDLGLHLRALELLKRSGNAVGRAPTIVDMLAIAKRAWVPSELVAMARAGAALVDARNPVVHGMLLQTALVLGLVLDGDFAAAKVAAHEGVRRATALRQRALVAEMTAYLLACAASERDWDDFELHARALTGALHGAEKDVDVATALEIAARLATDAGERDRAERCAALAASQRGGSGGG